MTCCAIPKADFCYDLCTDLNLILLVEDDDETPVDLTGTVAELKFKFRGDGSEFTLSSDVPLDGLDITDPSAGEITLFRTPTEAAAIFSEGFYDSKLLIADSLGVKDQYLDLLFQIDEFLDS